MELMKMAQIETTYEPVTFKELDAFERDPESQDYHYYRRLVATRNTFRGKTDFNCVEVSPEVLEAYKAAIEARDTYLRAVLASGCIGAALDGQSMIAIDLEYFIEDGTLFPRGVWIPSGHDDMGC
jgi:hypothetical protein